MPLLCSRLSVSDENSRLFSSSCHLLDCRLAQSVSVYLEIDLFARESARQLGSLLGIDVELFL